MSSLRPVPYACAAMRAAFVFRSGVANRFVGVLIALVCIARAAPACVGDCDGDGQVTVDEVITAVNIALGTADIGACRSVDRDGDGSVTIDEILSAITALLTGCAPAPTPTPTPTVTSVSTPNLPPVLPTVGVYRTYPGYPIQFPIGASDPAGDALTYAAGALPDGAQLDSASGIFSWTPAAEQIGPFYVPFTVSDAGLPTQAVPGQLVFAIVPPDACTAVTCDPATGCQSTLQSPTSRCCSGVALTRVAEPVSDCPGARVVFVGRNDVGFGKLRNCDQLHLLNSNQTSATLRFNVETRCMRTDDAPVTVHALLETGSPVRSIATDDAATVNMVPGPDGYAQRLQQGVQLPIRGGGPYIDLEGVEANLTVTVIDFDGVSVAQSVRVVLTFQGLPDLPETP